MQVTFYGAIREVTGSMHMISTEMDNLLLDCGLFQGRRREAEEKNRVLPFDPGIITNLILSHAHIDHSGRIPLLSHKGFNGRVVCTRITADACGYLLRDSAHIQESDANYLNYKTVRHALTGDGNRNPIGSKQAGKIKKLLKKNHHRLDVETINGWIRQLRLEQVAPLYTLVDAETALKAFDGYPFNTPIAVGQQTTCTFYPAGHILGSAISIIKAKINGGERTIAFTGDLGRFGKAILRDPCLDFAEQDRNIDLLIMESTYGDRLHEPVVDLKPRLKQVLVETVKRGGCVLIPSFAYGRTQEIIYMLHELYNENAVPKIPIYVDSPLATNITRVFGEHPEAYDRETHEAFLKKGQNPFDFKEVEFVEAVEDSIGLMHETNPHIVIAASGMCEAGRILHHLRFKIHNPKNTILIVGFMAHHTLGRRILEQGLAYQASGRNGSPPVLKFLNKEYPLKARVVQLGGFSAHADRNEMLRFLRQSNLNIKRIAVVHGEEDQSAAFADALRQAGYDANVPRAGQSIWVK
jgi:metallo-beta-lactamase family protein